MYDKVNDGPSVEAKSGKAKSLVVFIHGYGSNGYDLISLAPHMAESMPDTDFIAPNAPFPLHGLPMAPGYQWFELGMMDPGRIINGVRKVLPMLNTYVDEQLEKRGLTDKDLAFVGFSQGTMMSLQCALTRDKKCAGVLGYSGAFYPDPLNPVSKKPPVMLIHGAADVVLTLDYFHNAVEQLEAAGIVPETHIRKFLGHGIDPEGLDFGTDFLRKVLYTK